MKKRYQNKENLKPNNNPSAADQIAHEMHRVIKTELNNELPGYKQFFDHAKQYLNSPGLETFDLFIQSAQNFILKNHKNQGVFKNVVVTLFLALNQHTEQTPESEDIYTFALKQFEIFNRNNGKTLCFPRQDPNSIQNDKDFLSLCLAAAYKETILYQEEVINQLVLKTIATNSNIEQLLIAAIITAQTNSPHQTNVVNLLLEKIKEQMDFGKGPDKQQNLGDFYKRLLAEAEKAKKLGGSIGFKKNDLRYIATIIRKIQIVNRSLQHDDRITMLELARIIQTQEKDWLSAERDAQILCLQLLYQRIDLTTPFSKQEVKTYILQHNHQENLTQTLNRALFALSLLKSDDKATISFIQNIIEKTNRKLWDQNIVSVRDLERFRATLVETKKFAKSKTLVNLLHFYDGHNNYLRGLISILKKANKELRKPTSARNTEILNKLSEELDSKYQAFTNIPNLNYYLSEKLIHQTERLIHRTLTKVNEPKKHNVYPGGYRRYAISNNLLHHHQKPHTQQLVGSEIIKRQAFVQIEF